MNVIRANQNIQYENILTELRNPAQLKVTVEEAYDYAVSAGAKFVRLRYKGDVETYVKGFQPGILTISKGKSGTHLTWAGKQEGDGSVCKTGRLHFKGDKLGILWAECPKFPSNLKLLAACYLNDSAEWEIVDDADKREITEVAEGFIKSEGWSRKKIERKTSRSFRQVAQQEATAAQKAAPAAPAPYEPVAVEPLPPKVPDEQAQATSGTINAPVVEKRRQGRPRLKPVEGKKNDNNSVSDLC
jgi:hypothetical protein